VHGCEIADGSQVLTWAAIDNPDTPGEQEGYYCVVKYSGQAGNKSANPATEVDVETQTGKLTYADWKAVKRTDWCKEVDGEEGTCQRQSTKSQWGALLGDAPENYPQSWDADTKESSVSCSAYRFTSTLNNYMEIKYGTAYEVATGFMIYDNDTDYDAGKVNAKMNGAGTKVTMTFEAATALALGATVLTALSFF